MPSLGASTRSLLRGGLVLALTGMLGCSESTPSAPDTMISGVVTLVDEFGEPLPQVTGVQITMSSGGVQAVRGASADGRFLLPALAEGTRADLEFASPGFGTHRVAGVPAGTRGLQVVMLQRSTIQLLDLSAATRTCGEPCVDLAFTATNFFIDGHDRRLLRLFLGVPSGVGPGAYDQTMYVIVTRDGPGVTLSGDTAHVELQSLFGFDFSGYAAGTALELAIYGATENLPPSEDSPTFEDLSITKASTTISAPG